MEMTSVANHIPAPCERGQGKYMDSCTLKIKGFQIVNTSYGNQVKTLKKSCNCGKMTLELSAAAMWLLSTH